MAKRKKSAESPHVAADWREALDEFFRSPLAKHAASGLSERASIALHVDGETYFFRRRKGENLLERDADGTPEVHFWVPPSALRHLLALSALPGTGLGTMGVAVFEHVFAKDPARKIKFRVDSGFLTLWGKGYFSVLKAGGPEVASYVAKMGFGSLSRIKDVLKQMRG